MTRKIYNAEQIQQELPGWTYDGNCISKQFEFKDFIEAFGWMTSVALFCEKKDHHPNWSNVYNRVDISLYTHSMNAVTDLDIELAKYMDNL